MEQLETIKNYLVNGPSQRNEDNDNSPAWRGRLGLLLAGLGLGATSITKEVITRMFSTETATFISDTEKFLAGCTPLEYNSSRLICSGDLPNSPSNHGEISLNILTTVSVIFQLTIIGLLGVDLWKSCRVNSNDEEGGNSPNWRGRLGFLSAGLSLGASSIVKEVFTRRYSSETAHYVRDAEKFLRNCTRVDYTREICSGPTPTPPSDNGDLLLNILTVVSGLFHLTIIVLVITDLYGTCRTTQETPPRDSANVDETHSLESHESNALLIENRIS